MERGATQPAPPYTSLLLIAILLIGFALRVQRLTWQPLWWDEGYSVYFATEPFQRMLWLTARDIHPPLYYGILHGWVELFSSAHPPYLRLLSVVIGILTLPAGWILAKRYYPNRPPTQIGFLFLLAISPMHIFYSQEIRMYGLAMLFGICATVAFWQIIHSLDASHRRPAVLSIYLIAYAVFATLALHTLYYTGLLLLSHFLWGLWRCHKRIRHVLLLLILGGAILLANVPWWSYTFPRLLPYIADKVLSDQDSPLNLWQYTSRHLIAFTGGHVISANDNLSRLRYLGAIGVVLILTTRIIASLTAMLAARRSTTIATPRANSDLPEHDLFTQATGALLTFTLIPFSAAFLLNLRFPFFPEGGERVLLFILPYTLLLFARAVDFTLQKHSASAQIALLLMILSAACGIAIYYSTPRYQEHDYRPIIAQTSQQGKPDDSTLALFPWQTGYWRAYSPMDKNGHWLSPQPPALEQDALEWGPDIEQSIDTQLAQGTLWFPAPVSFGSDLPTEIEAYLRQRAINLEEQWHGNATRLSAWTQMPLPEMLPTTVQFDSLTLREYGVSPWTTQSANQPIAIQLSWSINDPETIDGAQTIHLRLQDQSGHTWAERTVQAFAQPAILSTAAYDALTHTIGLLIPVGLPPGNYELLLGVGHKDDERLESIHDPADLHYSPTGDLVTLAPIEIASPDQPLHPARLPVQHWLSKPAITDDIALLGYAGISDDQPVLAGTELALILFYQNGIGTPGAYNVYVRVLNRDGTTVAEWEGWPLPTYPTDVWPPGALVQLPLNFYIPGNVPTGDYVLETGLQDTATGQRTDATNLGTVYVQQRAINRAPTLAARQFQPPYQFGTHAQLLGYDIELGDNRQKNNTIQLHLYWQVLQPILPPHHVFVHVDTSGRATIAQSDGPPQSELGPAPTGSWVPGEYLTTVHTISLPPADENASPAEVINVGLYLPETQSRLPISQAGTPIGNSVTIEIGELE